MYLLYRAFWTWSAFYKHVVIFSGRTWNAFSKISSWIVNAETSNTSPTSLVSSFSRTAKKIKIYFKFSKSFRYLFFCLAPILHRSDWISEYFHHLSHYQLDPDYTHFQLGFQVLTYFLSISLLTLTSSFVSLKIIIHLS